MTTREAIVLASASPRRAELLRAAGIDFVVDPADVDESVVEGEAPDAYVLRLAESKARVVHARHAGRVVLAADTSVVVDAQILGKPVDAADAMRMLRLLSGRIHLVMTGVTVIHPERGPVSAVARTGVEFVRLSDDELEWYVDSGEPMDKAGAYAIQALASRFIVRIDGSYSNVVGLPIALVYQMLGRPT
jgi:septum formation protein